VDTSSKYDDAKITGILVKFKIKNLSRTARLYPQ
jgi:hypothetical protein